LLHPLEKENAYGLKTKFISSNATETTVKNKRTKMDVSCKYTVGMCLLDHEKNHVDVLLIPYCWTYNSYVSLSLSNQLYLWTAGKAVEQLSMM
jgi:hypothetical protein